MKSAFLLSKGLLCLYDKQNNTWLLVDMEFLFSCSTRHPTRSLRSVVSYRMKHSKRNFISTRADVLFSISSRVLFDHLTLLLSVDGGYSSWGTWSMCNTSCGMGVQSRSRTCTNPRPKYGGRTCDHQRTLGQAEERRMCNRNVNCPGNKITISIFQEVLSERL